MADASFDIVSQIDWQELTNAVDQVKREISTRFDFKGTQASIDLGKDELELIADDESKMKQLIDVLESKLIKRNISLKALDYGKLENAFSGTVRYKVKFIQGVDKEWSKAINKVIKDSKLKIQSQYMDEKIRVSAKSKDDLQAIIQLLKSSKEITIPLQFNNFK